VAEGSLSLCEFLEDLDDFRDVAGLREEVGGEEI
jgi:hypothetical protein